MKGDGESREGKGVDRQAKGKKREHRKAGQRWEQQRKKQCRHNEQKVRLWAASSKTRQQKKHRPIIKEQLPMECQHGDRHNSQPRPV